MKVNTNVCVCVCVYRTELKTTKGLIMTPLWPTCMAKGKGKYHQQPEQRDNSLLASEDSFGLGAAESFLTLSRGFLATGRIAYILSNGSNTREKPRETDVLPVIHVPLLKEL